MNDSPPATSSRRQLIGGWIVAAAFLTFSLAWKGGAGPVDLFQLGLLGVESVTPDSYRLDFEVDPLAMALRIAALLIGAILAIQLFKRQREQWELCGACGRRRSPAWGWSRHVPQIAWLSVVPASAYAALKVHWIAGGTFALDDPSIHSDLTFWSPGYGDTVLLVGLGVAMTFVMAYRVTWPPRWFLLVPCGLGSSILVLVGVHGGLMSIVNLFTPVIPESSFEPWIGLFVYPTFFTWGMCLALVTLAYFRFTRSACEECKQVSQEQVTH